MTHNTTLSQAMVKAAKTKAKALDILAANPKPKRKRESAADHAKRMDTEINDLISFISFINR